MNFKLSSFCLFVKKSFIVENRTIQCSNQYNSIVGSCIRIPYSHFFCHSFTLFHFIASLSCLFFFFFVGFQLNENIENELSLPTTEFFGQPRLSLNGTDAVAMHRATAPHLTPPPIPPPPSSSTRDAVSSSDYAQPPSQPLNERHSVSRQSLMGKIFVPFLYLICFNKCGKVD